MILLKLSFILSTTQSIRVLTGCGSLHDALNGISLLRRTRTTVHVTAGFPIEGDTTVFLASRVTTSFQ